MAHERPAKRTVAIQHRYVLVVLCTAISNQLLQQADELLLFGARERFDRPVGNPLGHLDGFFRKLLSLVCQDYGPSSLVGRVRADFNQAAIAKPIHDALDRGLIERHQSPQVILRSRSDF